jgi:hypothetical protein
MFWMSTVHKKPGHMLDSGATMEKQILKVPVTFVMGLICTVAD